MQSESNWLDSFYEALVRYEQILRRFVYKRGEGRDPLRLPSRLRFLVTRSRCR